MPKAPPEAIYLGGVLILSGILENLGINDNKIISGISNCIICPSNFQYVVNKSLEATFMRIAGFVYNYPCSISCDKGERTGLVCLVKEIAFWGGE